MQNKSFLQTARTRMRLLDLKTHFSTHKKYAIKNNHFGVAMFSHF